MISSDVSGPHAFKYLNRILNCGESARILENIIDEDLRDFLAKALSENPDSRQSFKQLTEHPFFNQSPSDNQDVKLSNQLSTLIMEQVDYYRIQKKLHTTSKEMSRHINE